jgi:hypothetical protein
VSSGSKRHRAEIRAVSRFCSDERFESGIRWPLPSTGLLCSLNLRFKEPSHPHVDTPCDPGRLSRTGVGAGVRELQRGQRRGCRRAIGGRRRPTSARPRSVRHGDRACGLGGYLAQRSAITRPPASPDSRFARFRAGIAQRLRVALWAVSARRPMLVACCGWTTTPRSPSTLLRRASRPKDASNVLHRLHPTTTASLMVASTSRQSFTSGSCARRSSGAGCSTSCRIPCRSRRPSRSSRKVMRMRKIMMEDAHGPHAREGCVGVLPFVCEAQGRKADKVL